VLVLSKGGGAKKKNLFSSGYGNKLGCLGVAIRHENALLSPPRSGFWRTATLQIGHMGSKKKKKY
jgi:hypothetical protein